MKPAPVPVLHLTVLVALGLLTLALLLAFVRLARGPSVPDRVVALDLISALVMGLITAFAILVEQPVFLDAVVALALIAFLGTVAFARYLEKRAIK